MTTKIRQQMLDLLDAGDRNALEVEAALNVLLLLQNHPTLLGEAPFAPILEHVEPPKELDPPMKAIQAGKKITLDVLRAKITLDVLRAKIVEMRDKKGLTAKDFLSSHGYAKLSDVPDTAYADLYAELEAM